MACDVALASAVLMLAALHPADALKPRLSLVANNATSSVAQSALSREPLYADIVGRARTLKAQADAYRKVEGATPMPAFDDFKARVGALAELDMKGHMDLAARGTDGDLKCILKGISQDLPKKLAEVAAATTPAARATALRDLSYLLNDNVEVVTAPPASPV